MSSHLHFPGFKEQEGIWENLRQAYLEAHSKKKKKKWTFSQIILPWDPKYSGDEIFSMADSQKIFIESLQEIRDKTTISVYSLSAWPALQAILESLRVNPELAKLIKSIIFLNPAKDPLHAVRIMDWILRNGSWEVFPEEHFLEWDPQEVYKTLIEWWQWNGTQFQIDLNLKRDAQQFNKLVKDIQDEFKIKILELSNPQDIVTNGKLPTRKWKIWAWSAMIGHSIKQSGEKVFELLN